MTTVGLDTGIDIDVTTGLSAQVLLGIDRRFKGDIVGGLEGNVTRCVV